jgi:hypothetical protein
MLIQPRWHTESDAVRHRLAEIGGLTAEILREAAVQGELGRASCTASHPPLIAPIVAWGDATRALRDQLLPLGWIKSDERNYALTISPDGEHAVVVATGDENTGSPVFEATTKSPKGPRTHEVITLNAVQLNLFEQMSDEEDARLAVLARRLENPAAFTWMLLIARTEDELKVELSLPIQVGHDGRPDHWQERIILPSIPLDGGPWGLRRAPEAGPDFDVDVTRRTA